MAEQERNSSRVKIPYRDRAFDLELSERVLQSVRFGQEEVAAPRNPDPNAAESEWAYENDRFDLPAIPKGLLETISQMIGEPDSNRLWHQFTVDNCGELIPSKWAKPFPPTTVLESVNKEDVPPKLWEWVNLSEKRRRDSHNAALESRKNHAKCIEAFNAVESKGAYVDKITESIRQEIAEPRNENKLLKAKCALERNLVSSLSERLLHSEAQRRDLSRTLDEKTAEPEKQVQAAQLDTEQQTSPNKQETVPESFENTIRNEIGDEIMRLIALYKSAGLEEGRSA